MTSDADYLRGLAERLMRVPVVHGTDQGDVDRLRDIARDLESLDSFREEKLSE